jgi:hypothetical protein
VDLRSTCLLLPVYPFTAPVLRASCCDGNAVGGSRSPGGPAPCWPTLVGSDGIGSAGALEYVKAGFPSGSSVQWAIAGSVSWTLSVSVGT